MTAGRPDVAALVAEHVKHRGQKVPVVSSGHAAFVDAVARACTANRVKHTELSYDIAKV